MTLVFFHRHSQPNSESMMTCQKNSLYSALACVALLISPLSGWSTPSPSDSDGVAGQQTVPWWKSAVMYQVYLRSFKDSNNDGVGDLNGLISRLDYLHDLGVDVIWISPHYQSPNKDNGYDVSNYRQVQKELGSMADFDHLVAELKKRNMRLVIDAVLNHTSDQHYWFQESRKSQTNPYRQFYIWRAGNNNQPPNNYRSFFGGSTWQYDDQTRQYYLHYYTTSQPDLNWDNPKVREEVYSLLQFWINKGVSGLRLDSIATISKPATFANVADPSDLTSYSHGPHLHRYIKELNQKVLAGKNIFAIGETPNLQPDELKLFFNPDRHELDAAVDTSIEDVGRNPHAKWQPIPWKLSQLRRYIDHVDSALGSQGWRTFFLGNHDNPRIVSYFGDDRQKYRIQSAKALATLILSQRGTPIIFQGDEIGMTNYPFTSINQFNDVWVHQEWKSAVESHHMPVAQFLATMRRTSRDNARTPFQWDTSANGGFSAGSPWLAVNPNYTVINAQANVADPESIYHYYQHLIQVRHQNPGLVLGDYHDLDPTDNNVYSYTRRLGKQGFLIVINFTEHALTYHLPSQLDIKTCLISSDPDHVAAAHQTKLQLQPWQSAIYILK